MSPLVLLDRAAATVRLTGPSLAFLMLASLVVMRLDTHQLALWAVLAGLYYAVDAHFRERRAPATASPTVEAPARNRSRGSRQKHAADRAGRAAPPTGSALAAPSKDPRTGYSREQKQDSKVPVQAPTLVAPDFDGQVIELIQQMLPTESSNEAAQRLAGAASRAVKSIFPEAEISCVTSGDIARRTAFGVAVPEVDIVTLASPPTLIKHLQARLTKGGLSMSKIDARKLQKSAIRVCTDQLVSVGGFKFRRSAFRVHEPKVTLMAPPALTGCEKSIPVDFSVNCVTPLFNEAVVTKCSQHDARVQGLVLIVKRWAKDRGLCHAAKGHLGPYAWTLLVIFFLQAGCGNHPLLPKIRGYRMVNNRMVVQNVEPWSPPPSTGKEEDDPALLSVGALFRRFLLFYNEVDFSQELISARLGVRSAAPKLSPGRTPGSSSAAPAPSAASSSSSLPQAPAPSSAPASAPGAQAQAQAQAQRQTQAQAKTQPSPRSPAARPGRARLPVPSLGGGPASGGAGGRSARALGPGTKDEGQDQQQQRQQQQQGSLAHGKARSRSGSGSTSGTGDLEQRSKQPQQQSDSTPEGIHPHIEDPFEQARNLGESVSAYGMERLLEELRRSRDLLTRNEPLTVLLDPWTPSGGEEGEEDHEGEGS